MKNSFALLFIAFISISAFGQKGESVTSLDAIAAQWSDDSYPSRNENSGMWEPMPSGKSEVKFIKNANGNVTSIDIDGDTYKANSSTSSAHVSCYYKGNDCLYLTESTIIKYYENYTTGMAEPKMFWGKKPGGVGSISKEITAYREAGKKIIEEQKSISASEESEARDKAEAERFAKYCINGKDVAKIEIINLVVPEKFGHFRGFTFDVVATLKNGNKISTKGYSEGYISDYTISYSASNYSGSLSSGFVKDDKIVITATSKYHSGITASAEVVVNYNEDISFNYNGMSWTRSAGVSANDFRIEVKQVKHASNGTELLKIRIIDGNGSNVVSEFKMKSSQTLHFFAKGGSGGSDNGTGYNGGDGGNVTVIKDPSVKEFNLHCENYGGAGGRGHNSSANGRDGRDGVTKEEVRTVNF